MRKGTTLEKIEKDIEKLAPEEKKKLVEWLAHRLKKPGEGVKKEYDLRELYGLGKGLWVNEDAQEYVDRLREDRT